MHIFDVSRALLFLARPQREYSTLVRPPLRPMPDALRLSDIVGWALVIAAGLSVE